MPDVIQTSAESANPQIAGGVSAAALSSLQKHYSILRDDRLVIQILSGQPSLYALVIEAVKPLHQAFGENRTLQLRAQTSDDDCMLNAVVQLPPDFEDPERALRSFDTAWWLDNCHRSDGALVFDYEIQDGV